MYTLASLLLLFLFVSIFQPTRVWSLDWKFVKGIRVGKMPQRAAAIPERHEIYVANREGCSISVISTLTNESINPIELGKAPKAFVAGHDGYLYVLTQDSIRLPCEQAENEDGYYWLDIVNVATHQLESSVRVTGQRWDDLALTSDGRLFLTRVLPFDHPGVYVFDTLSRELRGTPVILGSPSACPVDLALAEAQNELFVSYECGGPGGTYGHDSIGIYCLNKNKSNCLSAYDQLAIVSGIPNVGGLLSVSPDDSYLWAYGNDACSSAAYDHNGCPGKDPAKHIDLPSRIVNVIDTDSLVTRTYAFPMGDDGRYVSFSPELEAYVGGESGIKLIAKIGIGLPNRIQPPNDDTCRDLTSAGDIKFSRAGNTEYMYAVAGNAGAVCIFERPAESEIAPLRPSVQPTQVGKMYAIVIGIKSYSHGWDRYPLEHPVKDAAAIATELKKYYGFNVTILPGGSQCTGAECSVAKKQVIEVFEDLLYDNGKRREFNPQDQLLVYITGHGDRWPDSDGSSHPYLVTSDSILSYPPDQSAAATEVDYRDIWNLFGPSNIRHVLFFVDACFAGAYDPTFQIPLIQQGGTPFLRSRSLPEAQQRNRGLTRKYLSASPFSTEEVPDGSPFADAFIQALDTLRTNTTGYFAFESVLMQMASLNPQPRPSSFSSSDTPHGDFIFVPQTVDGAQQRQKGSFGSPRAR